MKKILLLLASVALLTACGTATAGNTTEETKEPTVYICNGSSSKRYHATDECRGLCNCRGGVKAVTLSQAEKMGRTPCQICY